MNKNEGEYGKVITKGNDDMHGKTNKIAMLISGLVLGIYMFGNLAIGIGLGLSFG